MKYTADILSMAADLYAGGWRHNDKDELREEYNLTEEVARTLCEIFEEWEGEHET